MADVSSLGSMVIPMMKKQGYDEDFAVGLTVTTACQGVLIPPSHNMVIYALAAGGVSIGTLFIAGLLPGILLGCSMLVMCLLMSRRYNFPKGVGVPRGARLKVLLDGILPMLTLVIILVMNLCRAVRIAADIAKKEEEEAVRKALEEIKAKQNSKHEET